MSNLVVFQRHSEQLGIIGKVVVPADKKHACFLGICASFWYDDGRNKRRNSLYQRRERSVSLNIWFVV